MEFILNNVLMTRREFSDTYIISFVTVGMRCEGRKKSTDSHTHTYKKTNKFSKVPSYIAEISLRNCFFN